MSTYSIPEAESVKETNKNIDEDERGQEGANNQTFDDDAIDDQYSIDDMEVDHDKDFVEEDVPEETISE